MWTTKTSVRSPTFFGPFALAMGLLVVINFSEPFWQNFYILKSDSANVTMKAGQWGVCTKLRNTTGVFGQTEFCTSKWAGYPLNFVYNETGLNQWPTIPDDATILGLNADAQSEVDTIFTKGQTNVLWINTISAITTVLTVISLATPPSYLGSERSGLYKIQKSGLLTIILGALSFILAFVGFIVTLALILPAKSKLNSIPGLTAELGNVQWFVLPSFLLMIPAFLSVLMKASENKYSDLNLNTQ